MEIISNITIRIMFNLLVWFRKFIRFSNFCIKNWKTLKIESFPSHKYRKKKCVWMFNVKQKIINQPMYNKFAKKRKKLEKSSNFEPKEKNLYDKYPAIIILPIDIRQRKMGLYISSFVVTSNNSTSIFLQRPNSHKLDNLNDLIHFAHLPPP